MTPLAMLCLCFAIVGWSCCFKSEAAFAESFISKPAKTSVMPSLHEVIVGQRTVKPQLCIVSQNFPSITRGEEHFAANLNFSRNFGFKDSVNVKWLPEHINWSVWQLVANKPSPANLYWICVSAAKIGKIEPLDVEVFGFGLVTLAGFSPYKPTRLNANDWQFEGNGGSSAESGGVGGCLADPYRFPHVAGLSSVGGGEQLQLSLAGIPKLVGGPLESEGEKSNRDSSESGDNPARLVKNLGNLNTDEWNNLIRGAAFLFGLFGCVAYIIVGRDERKNQNDKSRASAEPK